MPQSCTSGPSGSRVLLACYRQGAQVLRDRRPVNCPAVPCTARRTSGQSPTALSLAIAHAKKASHPTSAQPTGTGRTSMSADKFTHQKHDQKNPRPSPSSLRRALMALYKACQRAATRPARRAPSRELPSPGYTARHWPAPCPPSTPVSQRANVASCELRTAKRRAASPRRGACACDAPRRSPRTRRGMEEYSLNDGTPCLAPRNAMQRAGLARSI